MNSNNAVVSGWGQTSSATVKVVTPACIEELQEFISLAKPKSLIARGLGRSYGDAAQIDSGTVIKMDFFNKIVLDKQLNTVTAGSGVSLEALLRVIVPNGFFLPVTPGTSQVTVGGAIAADVHGKNHHSNGSFGNYIQKIVLIDGNAQIKELTPHELNNENSKTQFWSTIGGMGLTGAIIEATFSLIPITSNFVSVDTFKFNNIDALMSAMYEADKKYKYSVAWVDSLNFRGRGVLSCGDHVSIDRLTKKEQLKRLDYKPNSLGSAPNFLPGGLLNKFTVRVFNESWYVKAPKRQLNKFQDITPFFHPLDGVKNWNRIYGTAGFIQYQFVVPDDSANLIPFTLDEFRSINAPSFLTVLKRLGPGNKSPLSFPIKGWTLAADLPASIPGLFELLHKLDEVIASSGGRIYLAKDARQSKDMFMQSYPEVDKWIAAKSSMDPNKIFCSDIALRLGL